MDGRDGTERLPSVAILGLAGRLPGVRSSAALWRALCGGDSTVAGFDRADDAADFDAAVFGLSPAAAAAFTVAQRLFLACAWDSLEHAGYAGDRVPGPVAVFAAPGQHSASAAQPTSHSSASSEHDGPRHGLATVVSRQLNLTGPSLDVQAGSAGSLVAVHLACQSLWSGECIMALAGGAAVRCDEADHGHIDPRDRRASARHRQPRDASAADRVLTRAAACVVLKRLDDAVRDGDRIMATIRGSAVNHAGAETGAATPGIGGQAQAIAEALAVAGVEPEDVSCVEAHGAGGSASDTVEMLALSRAFRTGTTRRQFCAVGSVKTHIGHAGVAAGIVGLVRMVLALEHRELPPALDIERRHFGAPLTDSPFYVDTTLRGWEVAPGRRRVAGVTALDEGGTTAHVIVEEGPEARPRALGRGPHIVALSARSPAALEELSRALAEHLVNAPDTDLADVAYTLFEGRKTWPYRRAVLAESTAAAAALLTGRDRGEWMTGTFTGQQPPPVVWLFDGRGFRPGTGAGLLANVPIYRTAIDEALSALDAELEPSVRGLLDSAHVAAEHQVADEPSRMRPALLAAQYATGRLLEDWGVSPAALMGEGDGELAAACLAGVLDIRQAMALAALPCTADLEGFCATLTFQAPTRPLISSATDDWMTATEAIDPAYWARRAGASRHASRGQAISALKDAVLVDVGPGRFENDATDRSEGRPAVAILSTIRPLEEPGSDLAFLLTAVARLWVAGVPVDATRLYAPEPPGRIALPTQRFDRSAAAIDRNVPPPAARSAQPAFAIRFAWPVWERSLPPPQSVAPESWLVLADESPLVGGIIEALRQAGHRVTTATAGSGFAATGPDRYSLHPGRRTDYEALARALQAAGRAPQRVLHLWAATTRAPDTAIVEDGSGQAAVERDALARNYFSLIHLAETFAATGAALRISCVSTGIQAVAANDEVHPARAVLLGPCAAIPRACPGITCTSIDVEWPATEEERNRLLDQLLGELQATGPDCEIALRGRDRWIRRRVPVDLPAATSQWIRAGGTYVIATPRPADVTALRIAEHLASTGPVKLALIAQTALDDAAARETDAHALEGAIAQLRAGGAEVWSRSVDLLDLEAARRTMTEVLERFGAIDGLFVVGSEQNRPPRVRHDEVLDTPLLDAGFRTALALDGVFSSGAFASAPPGLFVFVSAHGPPLDLRADAESAAATAVIDRLARNRRERSPGRTVSINWSRLAGSSAADLSAASGTVADLPEALDRILAVDVGAEVVASRVPLAPRDLSLDTDAGAAARPPDLSPTRPTLRAAVMPLPEIERALATMWREALQLDDVGVGDDFFALGGHSLGAVRMFVRIRDTFGVDLPLATLFEARTIADLAVLLHHRLAGDAIGAGAEWDPKPVVAPSSHAMRNLVTVQRGTDGLPLFVVHGAGGNVLNLRDLARALGPTRTLYGLQAAGTDGVSAPAASIEQMAQSYLDEIRMMQPRGPYLLGGYSGGGVIAFEMARRLEAAGETVGLLALIDTFHPQMRLPEVTVRTRLQRLRGEGMAYLRDAIERRRQARRDARDARRIEAHRQAGEPIPLALRELNLMRHFARAVRGYAPAPWSGQALLFKAEQVDYYYQAGGPHYGWDDTIRGGLEVVPIPGDHDSIVVGTNAERIARRLLQAIGDGSELDQDKRE